MLQPQALNLPYATWQPGQWDVISRVVSAFSPDTPYVLLEAPTGVGKSAIALAVARLLDLQTVTLTGTLQLQEQYRQSLSLPVAQGRGNFTCNIAPTTAAEAPCVYRAPCDLKNTDGCDYYRQRNHAARAQESVLNYQYWLAQVNYAKLFRPSNGNGLLVCDEAHALDEELRRFASITVTRRDCRDILSPYPNDPDELPDWLRWAEKVTRQFKEDIATLKRSTVHPDDLDEPERRYRRALTRVWEAAHSLLDPRVPDDGWVVRSWLGGAELKPVWVQPFTPTLLLRNAGRILFMTATVLNKDIWCYQLGIPPEKTVFLQVPSPFPVENRPLYFRPVGKVKTADPDVLDRLVAEIDTILDAHPDQRGLIHTVSYKLAQHVVGHSRHKHRLMTHKTSAEKTINLQHFRAQADAVFVSPSVTTGVDLPYDLCRFQIIAKLSFPDLGDSQVKKRMKLGPDGQPNALGKRWYEWVTACELVQAYGRGVRAHDDACVSYLLDGNYDWFQHTVRDLLPIWFTQAIKHQTARVNQIESIGDLVDRLQKRAKPLVSRP